MKYNFTLEARLSFGIFALCFSSSLLFAILSISNYSSYFSTILLVIIFSSLWTAAVSVACDKIFRLDGSSAFSIAWRAGALGSGFAAGLLILIYSQPALRPFGIYVCLFTFFHWSEYFVTAVFNSEMLKIDSFLLNHSLAYWAAAFVSWLEYGIEYFFFPSIKLFSFITSLGLLLCAIGEIFRKAAMITAGRNFTHLIQFRKRPHHQLVTHGVYSIFRHPSYVGWFWWSVGTQITLCNPICTIIYAVVSWRFFNERIEHEELTLINFFGEDYVRYQKQVPTGLPGITGYRVRD